MNDPIISNDSPAERLRDWVACKPQGPWFVTIYPTNRCNLVCKMCWQRGVDKLEFSRETSDERLLELVDECADMGVREWLIVGGGEPMLRSKAVMAMCERIRARGMNGVLQCNGTVFSDADFTRLMDIGWDRLTFSVDGPTEEINDAVRSAGSFVKATGHFRRFSAMKRERGATHPSLWLSTVVNRLNYDRLDSMANLVHDCGGDGIQGVVLIPEGPSGRELAIGRERLDEAAEHIRRAARHAREIGLQEMLEWTAYNISVPVGCPSRGRRAGDPGIHRVACLEPWTSVLILPDGEVGPCCAFWDENAPSIQNRPFREIWEGYLAGIRKGFLEDRLPPYCARCQQWLRMRSNTLLAELDPMPAPPKWSEMGAVNFLCMLPHKTLSSIGRYGLRGAVKRGREWLALMRK